jgi:hypothetical protein
MKFSGALFCENNREKTFGATLAHRMDRRSGSLQNGGEASASKASSGEKLAHIFTWGKCAHICTIGGHHHKIVKPSHHFPILKETSILPIELQSLYVQNHVPLTLV